MPPAMDPVVGQGVNVIERDVKGRMGLFLRSVLLSVLVSLGVLYVETLSLDVPVRVVPAALHVLLGLAIGLLLATLLWRERRDRVMGEIFQAIALQAFELAYFRRPDGSYLYVSNAARELTGYEPEDFYATPNFMDRLIHPEDLERWSGHVHEVNEKGHRDVLEFRIVTRAGETRWIQHICTGILDGEGRVVGVHATNIDITEQKNYKIRIEHMANFDPLTDLPNRRRLASHIADSIGEAKAIAGHFAVLFLDLDRFKHINDTHGHAFGDQLLRLLAKRFGEAVSRDILLARFGGDEFVIVTPLIDDPLDAENYASHLLGLLVEPFQVAGQAMHISGSIGVAVYPYDGEDADTLIKNADAAVYKAKKEGRDNVQFYAPLLADQAAGFLTLETRLRQAIAQGDILLHYQAQYDCRGGHRVVGCEALARWPTGDGMIPPAEFIPVAEETGLIIELGRQLSRQAIAQAVRWHADGHPLKVSVNLSPRELREAGLIDWLIEEVGKAGLPPGHFGVEVTESGLFGDLQHIRPHLEKLAAAGITIALDDFGTGYSSLAYLRELPISLLKIDRSFITELNTDARQHALLKNVISLAHDLGMQVVVEGLETDAQYTVVRELGCDIGQGYLFARPVPACEFLLDERLAAA